MNKYTTRPDLQKMMRSYHEGTATEAEKAFINRYYDFFDQYHKEDPQLDATNAQDMQQEMEAWLLNYINNPKQEAQLKRTKLWPHYAGIAAALIGIAIGIYFFTVPRTNTVLHPELVSGSQYANDIAPGGNKATLTSADGKTMVLSAAQTGLAVNATTLTYNDGTEIDPSALGMTNGDSRSLQVSTPRGGTYFVILQDGTKVWLNADSKLEFYSDYRNKLQRIVKLIGEADFEVAKDARRPFIVDVNGQRTTVLGTHFNISAYEGETIKTTLIEGSVRVASLAPSGRGAAGGEGSVTLRPNQQSILADNNKITITEVNALNAIAWRNGYFMFNDEPLENILPKIARWYNVQITYESPEVKKLKFFGTVSRFENASKVLEKLELTDKVRFEITGQQIKVFRKHP